MKILIKPREILTEQGVESLGWIRNHSLNPKKGLKVYEKGNYWLYVDFSNTYVDVPVVTFYAIDPVKIEFIPDPEHFKVVMKCPTLEFLKMIEENI